MRKIVTENRRDGWVSLFCIFLHSSSHQTRAVIKREAHKEAHIHTNVGVVTIIVDGNVVHLHCGEQERGGVKSESVGRFFFSMWMWVCVEIQIEGTRRLGKDEGWLCPVIDPDSGHLRRNIE